MPQNRAYEFLGRPVLSHPKTYIGLTHGGYGDDPKGTIVGVANCGGHIVACVEYPDPVDYSSLRSETIAEQEQVWGPVSESFGDLDPGWKPRVGH